MGEGGEKTMERGKGEGSRIMAYQELHQGNKEYSWFVHENTN